MNEQGLRSLLRVHRGRAQVRTITHWTKLWELTLLSDNKRSLCTRAAGLMEGGGLSAV